MLRTHSHLPEAVIGMDFHSSNADSAVAQVEVVTLVAEQLRHAEVQDDEAVGTLRVADGHSYFAA